MIDESGKLIPSSQLFNSLERRVGSQRPAKRPKTSATRVLLGDLQQSHVSGNSRVSNDSTPKFCFLEPCIHDHATLSNLPLEVIHHILDSMPLISVGSLSQTSVAFNRIVASWLDTTRVHSRIASLVGSLDLSETQLTGRLALPAKLHEESRNLGVLLKRFTCPIPTIERLAIFHHFTQKLRQVVLQKRPNTLPHVLSSINGVVLHALIAGWDEKECTTVFHVLNKFFNVSSTVDCYLEHDFSMDVDTKFLSVRVHIRSMFLDFASPGNSDLWVRIVFDGFKVKTPTVAAKLLLLLYTPLSNDGQSLWDFVADEDNASYCLINYKILAETMVKLTRQGNNTSTLMSFVQLYDTVIQNPSEWPLKAQASLLLCSHFIDSKAAMSYFKELAKEGNEEVAIVMLTEIFAVASDFIGQIKWDPNLRVNHRALLILFRNVLNAGWGHDERNCILTEFWKDVRLFADDLLQSAREIGHIDEVNDFWCTWTNVACEQVANSR